MPLSTLHTVQSVTQNNAQVAGWTNFGNLNSNMFVKIQDTEYGDMVIGRLVSYSLSNESTWENKFEGMDEDSKQPFLAGVIQSGELAESLGWEALGKLKGKTLITEAQSQQIWTGIQTLNISIEIEFKAFADAYSEVELPIAMLYKMQSPILSGSKVESAKTALNNTLATKDVNESSSGILGDIPKEISLDFLNKRFNSLYVLESISEDVDHIKIDKSGNRIYQRVSLQFGSVKGITKDKIQIDGDYRKNPAIKTVDMDSIIKSF